MKPTEVFFSRFLSVDCNKILKEKLALLILDFGRQTQFDLFGAWEKFWARNRSKK